MATNAGQDTQGSHVPDAEHPRLVSAEPLFVVSADQRIVSWNEHAELLFSRSAHGVLGRSCWSVVRACEADGRGFCRPSCPVADAAARGTVLPAQDVRIPTGAPQQRTEAEMRTVLLDGDPKRPMVLHLLRPAAAPGKAEPAREETNELTSREREVLASLCRGSRTVEIAGSLAISQTTVRNHVQHILEKLSVHTRAEAVALAYRHSLANDLVPGPSVKARN